jgi:hypothetical protein
MRHPSLYRSARVRPLRSRHVGLRRMRVGAVGTRVPGSEPRAPKGKEYAKAASS